MGVAGANPVMYSVHVPVVTAFIYEYILKFNNEIRQLLAISD
jgi:hypothetical protein